MDTRFLDSQQKKIEYLLKNVPVDPSIGLELQAHWAKYTCIVICGYIESSIIELLRQYVEEQGSPRAVSNYVISQLKFFQNASVEKIVSLIASFDKGWEASLSAFINDERRAAAGLKRYYLEGSLHFITFSCYRRLPHLRTAARRDLLLRVLEQARRRYQFALLGYVVMPEHVHLLMTMPSAADPSVVMKVVKERFTRLLRKQERFIGPMWQKRFYDFNVCTEKKRVEKLRYMHRNPVKRGLVSSPEEWDWSTFGLI